MQWGSSKLFERNLTHVRLLAFSVPLLIDLLEKGSSKLIPIKRWESYPCNQTNKIRKILGNKMGKSKPVTKQIKDLNLYQDQLERVTKQNKSFNFVCFSLDIHKGIWNSHQVS